MQSFRTRILGLLLAIVVTTQVATMFALVVQTHREAQSRAQQQLSSGGRVLASIMHSRAEQLRDAVHVLVADYGFKEAVTSADQSTILSALDNSARTHRCGSGCVLRSQRQSDRHHASRTCPCAGTMRWPALDAAHDSGVIYRSINSKPYLLVIAPVRAPVTVGWAAIGFGIDAALATQMRSLLGRRRLVLRQRPAARLRWCHRSTHRSHRRCAPSCRSGWARPGRAAAGLAGWR